MCVVRVTSFLAFAPGCEPAVGPLDPPPKPAEETIIDTGSPPTPDVVTASGILFRLIPAGTFDMGCTAELVTEGHCDENELDVHEVTITRPFLIAETEITQDEFFAVSATSPSFFKGCGDCPVESISWHEAVAFLNALSAAEGLPPCFTCTDDRCDPVSDVVGCAGYRMPTEAEWEYAARSGYPFVYSGSDVASDVAWFSANSDQTSHPVRSKAPNAWSLYGLSGNVWEWIGDGYEEEYGPEPEIDPSPAGDGTTRVKRGGSWFSLRQLTRVSNRSWDTPPDERRPSLGVRPVRTIEP